MTKSEEKYQVGKFEDVTLESGHVIPSLGYVGSSRIYQSNRHQGPIALKEIAADNRTLPALDQITAMNLVID